MNWIGDSLERFLCLLGSHQSLWLYESECGLMWTIDCIGNNTNIDSLYEKLSRLNFPTEAT